MVIINFHQLTEQWINLMSKTVKFWDKVANRYSKSAIDDMPAYQHKLDVTQTYMSTNHKVLELGCGTGSTALIHAPYVKHILATDISNNMLDIARSKAKAEGVHNIEFCNVSVEDIQVNEPVDIILALSLLHLLEDKEQVLTKMIQWLKPGGYLVTSTVCLGDSMKWFKFVGPLGRIIGLMPLVKVFTSADLIQSMLKAGFAVDYQWQSGRSTFIVATKPS